MRTSHALRLVIELDFNPSEASPPGVISRRDFGRIIGATAAAAGLLDALSSREAGAKRPLPRAEQRKAMNCAR